MDQVNLDISIMMRRMDIKDRDLYIKIKVIKYNIGLPNHWSC